MIDEEVAGDPEVSTQARDAGSEAAKRLGGVAEGWARVGCGKCADVTLRCLLDRRSSRTRERSRIRRQA